MIDQNNYSAGNVPLVKFHKEMELETFSNSIKGVTIPSVSIKPARSNENAYVSVNNIGTNFVFEPLIIRFTVDENWESYMELFKYMVSTSNFQTGRAVNQVGAFKEPNDIIVFLRDRTRTKIVKQLNFKQAWVSDISDVELTYTDDMTTELVCTATFMYATMIPQDANGDDITVPSEAKFIN
ncbi:MAG: hypothetical protein CL489_09250 [Acidobacteria bacterium]|nr:hypothetical protein [Acidobacteriota bacterium]|tara:strand:+ start:5725 stop:6270 length:546 start_codon:yes stop_codon:yes gene_type:complete